MARAASTRSAAYLGTVWPHDNSPIAWGPTHYGYRAEAARIAMAILEAAT